MPELPEVETIVRDLRNKLKGQKINDFSCDRPKLLNLPLATFKKKIVGRLFINARRRAKMIILDLDNDLSILIHLKMTGQLILRGKSGKYSGGGHPIDHYLQELPNNFTHAIFTLTSGQQLFFNDIRMFGYLKLIESIELPDLFKNKLGPEPLNQSFTLPVFKELINKRKIGKIKPLLMDQSFIAGIGNIYADEVCHYAKIQPTRIAGLLKDDEVKRLYQGIRKILPQAIALRGTSADTYVDSDGKKGSYEEKLKVYGRKSKKCLTCQTPLKSMKLNGRTTVYCPSCQK
ncbi:bifunctional DNA-formamidopyrimidine glycosylase/DNA-(apurinic or apyrimidinic site) lyase [Patescibacteria group bacterium]|nr:bifunctional DNA-formamidopyrimidine glycosylase/DNA-(apurinic or apyrimidinic site) lyase [Patescibacteria group bacterium]